MPETIRPAGYEPVRDLGSFVVSFVPLVLSGCVR